MSTEKITSIHLQRKAVVYARQSTLRQLVDHQESTKRQYGLKSRAHECGWSKDKIICIDSDLGQSGASAQWRKGFQQLAEEVAHGRVGGIFALEVSRLARSSADWHRLLELCVLADVIIADEQAVYSPKDYNDRLLLGLKGTMSEAELYWMRLRLEGGKLSKARRGELFFCPPAGYIWDAAIQRFRFDPDLEVQNAVKLVFERFRIDGSAYGVSRYLHRMGIKLPSRHIQSKELHWIPPRQTQILKMLHNPIYAGTYAFGRKEERLGLVDGTLKKRKITKIPRESWKSVIHNHHPGYISWEEYLANEKKLRENMSFDFNSENRGASRVGTALLQGLVLCGRCGRRMHVRYQNNKNRTSQYLCQLNTPGPKSLCWDVAGSVLEKAIEKIFLDTVTNSQINLALSIANETQQQVSDIDQQLKLRMERQNYQARLAERRYKAIDPDNRIVAYTLEKEWEAALQELKKTEEEYEIIIKSQKLEFTLAEREQVLKLAKDLRSVWYASTTSYAERKNLLRILIREITLTPVDVPQRQTRIQIWWQSGAVSELTVPRNDRYTSISTPKEVVNKIHQLFNNGQNDDQIAKELTHQKIFRKNHQQWNKEAVRRLRYGYGFHSPESTRTRRSPARRADGLYSVRGVAERLGVKPALVANWANTGLLAVAEGGKTTKARWFHLDDTTIEKLLKAKDKKQNISKNIDIVT